MSVGNFFFPQNFETDASLKAFGGNGVGGEDQNLQLLIMSPTTM